HAIFEHGGAASLIQALKVFNDIWFCCGNLDCLHRAEDFADGAGDAARGVTAGLAIFFQAVAHRLRYRYHACQWEEGQQRDGNVDPEHDNDGEEGEKRLADAIERPANSVFGLPRVVAKTADRLSGRLRDGARSRSLQNAFQQIATQPATHRETMQ